MEQPLDQFESEQKLFKSRHIWVGTFIGGPLVATYFIAENFKALGQYDKIQKTWIFGVVFTIILFAALFLIPGTENIPSFIVPLSYTFGAQSYYKQQQEKPIMELIRGGSDFFGWGRVIAIMLIGAVITSGAVLGIAFMFP
jgi:hypothetical protein